MESGHLILRALTFPSGGNARLLKSKHPFLPATQQLISSSDHNNRSDSNVTLEVYTEETHGNNKKSAALWADQR